MTTIELEASKAELVREILNIENSETIGKLPATFSMIPHAIQLCVPATPSSS